MGRVTDWLRHRLSAYPLLLRIVYVLVGGSLLYWLTIEFSLGLAVAFGLWLAYPIPATLAVLVLGLGVAAWASDQPAHDSELVQSAVTT